MGAFDIVLEMSVAAIIFLEYQIFIQGPTLVEYVGGYDESGAKAPDGARKCISDVWCSGICISWNIIHYIRIYINIENWT